MWSGLRTAIFNGCVYYRIRAATRELAKGMKEAVANRGHRNVERNNPKHRNTGPDDVGSRKHGAAPAQLGVSEATLYVWMKRFLRLGVPALRDSAMVFDTMVMLPSP